MLTLALGVIVYSLGGLYFRNKNRTEERQRIETQRQTLSELEEWSKEWDRKYEERRAAEAEKARLEGESLSSWIGPEELKYLGDRYLEAEAEILEQKAMELMDEALKGEIRRERQIELTQ